MRITRKPVKQKKSYQVYPDDQWFEMSGWRCWVHLNDSGIRMVLERGYSLAAVLQESHRVEWPFSVGRATVENLTMSFLKKAVQHAQTAGAGVPLQVDAVMAKKLPALAEYMCTVEVEGKARQTSTLSISWTPQEGFKGFLNDKETGSYLCVTSEGFQGLLAALDARLQSDDPGWRKSNFAPTPKKKKA